MLQWMALQPCMYQVALTELSGLLTKWCGEKEMWGSERSWRQGVRDGYDQNVSYTYVKFSKNK